MDEEDQETTMFKQKSTRKLGEQEEIDANNPNEVAYHR